jgi:hypothetical protein
MSVAPNACDRKESSVPIDIDKLTESELVDLNHRIVARLRFLQQMRAHTSMLEFSLGERVNFQPDGHPVLFGVIPKYNRKSVTVITETGQHWTASPVFLRKIKPAREVGSEGGKVVNLPAK